MLKKVNSGNTHLWYAIDDDYKIIQVSLFEKEIDSYIKSRG